MNDNDSDISDDHDQDDEIEREIDFLREKILEVVDKIISEQDTMKNYVLMNNIEEIAEFLGESIISERLLPYILSFPNLKDDLLTIATLKCLRILSHNVAGNDELKYLITSCDNLFYDLNEVIVVEALKTVHYIVKQHSHAFESENMYTPLVEKLIFFGMHPSNQIRQYTVKIIYLLMKDKSIVDIYHKVIPLIKRHIKTLNLINISDEEGLDKFLNHQVSRFSFDLGIGKFYFTSRESLLLSIRDKKIL